MSCTISNNGKSIQEDSFTKYIHNAKKINAFFEKNKEFAVKVYNKINNVTTGFVGQFKELEPNEKRELVDVYLNFISKMFPDDEVDSIISNEKTNDIDKFSQFVDSLRKTQIEKPSDEKKMENDPFKVTTEDVIVSGIANRAIASKKVLKELGKIEISESPQYKNTDVVFVKIKNDKIGDAHIIKNTIDALNSGATILTSTDENKLFLNLKNNGFSFTEEKIKDFVYYSWSKTQKKKVEIIPFSKPIQQRPQKTGGPKSVSEKNNSDIEFKSNKIDSKESVYFKDISENEYGRALTRRRFLEDNDLSISDRELLSKTIANKILDIIDIIKNDITNGSVDFNSIAGNFTEEQLAELQSEQSLDFKKIAKIIGSDNIIEIAINQLESDLEASLRKDGVDEETIDDRINQIRSIYLYFTEYLNILNRTLKKYGFVFDAQNESIEEIEEEEETEFISDSQNTDDTVDDENNTLENWMISYLNKSFFSNISGDFKTRFSRIKKIDENGEFVKNKFGGIEHYDEKQIFIKILKEVYDKESAEEQLDVLLKNERGFPWAKSVYDMLSSDENLKTLFFTTFRKDQVIYSVIEDGIFKQINITDNSFKRFLSDLDVQINEKDKDPKFEKYKFVYQKNENKEPSQRYFLNKENIAYHIDRINKIKAELANNFGTKLIFNNKKELSSFLKGKNFKINPTQIIYEALYAVGFTSVSKETVSLFLNQSYFVDEKIAYNDSNLDKISTELKLLLSTLNKAPNSVKFDDQNDMEVVSIKSKYKKIFSLIDVYSDFDVESTIYNDGKMYNSFVSPNYINKAINKLTKSSDEKFLEYINENFKKSLFHGSYYDFNFFNSWIKDLEKESSGVRKQMKFSTHLNTVNGEKKVKFEDLTERDYYFTCLAGFFSTKENEFAQYALPIMADKSISGFISWKKYKTFEIEQRMFSVFMQELERIREVIINAENGERPKVDGYDVKTKNTPKNKIKKEVPLGEEGGAMFHFLPFLNKELREVYNFKNNSPIVEMMRNYLYGNENDAKTIIEKQNIDLISKFISSKMKIEYNEFKSHLQEKGILQYLKDSFGIDRSETDLVDPLYTFFVNDFYAQIQIIQIMSSDLAFYSGVTSAIKRFAQFRANGAFVDKNAKDENGNLYIKQNQNGTSTKKYIVLSDFKKISPHIEEIKAIHNAELQEYINKVSTNNNLSEKEKRRFISKKTNETRAKTIAFENTDRTDGQGIMSLKWFRSYMGALGRFNDPKVQKIYSLLEKVVENKKISPEDRNELNRLSLNDVKYFFGAFKPFVFANNKLKLNDGRFLKRPIQIKNSEIFPILIYKALTSSDNDIIKLLKFMNDNDIDVIITKSNIKSGSSGVYNIDEYNSVDDFIAFAEKDIYMQDENTKEIFYNQERVLEIEVEDVALQQEISQHFEDFDSSIGVQVKKLFASNLTKDNSVEIDGEKITGSNLFKMYDKVFGEIIKREADKFLQELGLTKEIIEKIKDGSFFDKENYKDRIDFNLKFSKILLKNIERDKNADYNFIISLSLDENGEFLVPLNDPENFSRISKTISSIIKKRITKSTFSTAQLVQVSDGFSFRSKTFKEAIKNGEIELDENLKIVYNYDENGKIIGIKHLEAILPAYSKDFYKHFIDKDGNLRIDWLPDHLKEALLYRIPTESEYSIIPIKIVGFSDKLNGGIVKLPVDITTITGADFDIDKMYAFFRELNKNELSLDEEEYFFEMMKKENNLIGKYSKMRTIGVLLNNKKISALEKQHVLGLYNEYLYKNDIFRRKIYKKNVSVMKNISKSKKPDNVIKNASIETLKNGIFDSIYGTLTSGVALYEQMTPGGYINLKQDVFSLEVYKIELEKLTAEAKASGRTLTKKEILDLYENIKLRSIDDLNSTLDKRWKDKPIASILTRALNKKDLDVSNKLIGAFANGNSGHAVLKHYDIDIVLKNQQISSTNNTVKLDGFFSENGVDKIASYLKEYLAASVDSVKDPVLHFLGINMQNVSVVLTMLRMGKSMEFVNLFLSQPILKRVFSIIETQSSDNEFVNIEKIILNFIKEKNLRSLPSINDLKIEDLILSVNDNIDDVLAMDNEEKSNAEQVLLTFLEYYKISQDVDEISFFTKMDTVKNAAGPDFAETLSMEMRVNRFMERLVIEDAYLSKRAADFMVAGNENSSDMLTSYYNSTVGLSNIIFGIINPMYVGDFKLILEECVENIKFVNADLIKKLYNAFVTFSMFRGANFVDFNDEVGDHRFLCGTKDATEYYIKKFPKMALRLRNKLLDNPKFKDNILLKKALQFSIDEDSELVYISIPNIGMDSDMKKSISSAWADLIFAEEKVGEKANYTTKDFGMDLFFYNIYRSGFGFGFDSFFHLFPVEIKARFERYKNFLKTNQLNNISAAERIAFISVFKRHSENIKRTAQLYNLKTERDNGNISNVKTEKVNDKIIMTSFVHKNNIGDVIRMKINKKEFLFKLNKSKLQYTYELTTRLGLKGVAKEYTRDMLGLDRENENVPSIFDSNLEDFVVDVTENITNKDIISFKEDQEYLDAEAALGELFGTMESRKDNYEIQNQKIKETILSFTKLNEKEKEYLTRLSFTKLNEELNKYCNG